MTEAAFWDRLALKYSRKPIDNVPAYEATLDRTRTFLHADDHILEMGCGTGGTAILLAPSVAHVTATDISEKMVEIARAKKQPGNVSFQQAAALSPVPDAPFDAICAFNLLHLLPDLPKALAHLKASVKPGGFVITKTPCLGEMNMFLPIAIGAMRLVGRAPYVNSFTINALEQAFRETGFTLVETAHFLDQKNSRFIVAKHR
ncbi:class I SAM-dependent methyltransferase [Yoonia sp. 2307UL14-13]|uniref:class I SAM-dependent methyltransferase n=1 Tax=Yoonia sp. 2307UL14-13 TaxID=3126506 RepID=UPI00309BF6DE